MTFVIFFPQFQETQINNKIWGKGFTDWSLIQHANAFDLWPQRRAPKIGFYDLSDSSVIERQFSSIIDSGATGISLYSYYFSSGHQLDSVEKYMLKYQPSLPYFLTWANEPWSKRWAGSSYKPFLEIDFTSNPSLIYEHCRYLSKHFLVPSYKKILDRPLLCFYEPSFQSSKTESIVESYRQSFRDLGFDPFLAFFAKRSSDLRYSSMYDGFYIFQPRFFFNSSVSRFSGYIYNLLNCFHSGSLLSFASSIRDYLIQQKTQEFLL